VNTIVDFISSPLTSISRQANPLRLSRWKQLVPRIGALEPELMKLSDEQLRKRSLSLRYRAKSGEPLGRLLVEAYALVREAGRRTLNMRHFDVQLLGGIAMFHHSIAEMQTGEGKTLTATLAMYLYALVGKGCHLATVNDYLARRDAEWMMPLYRALGMSVGVIETQMAQDDRRKNYQCDVTYGELPVRRDLRHGQGVRLRFPPRPPVAAENLRGSKRPARRHAGSQERDKREARAGRSFFRVGRRGR
jgi:preprotein translocase subunit SecA